MRVCARTSLLRGCGYGRTYPYLLTKFDDIRAVLSNPMFSCEPNREGFPHVFEGRMVADKADRSFLRLDNPEHDRLRRMVTKEFTVRRIEQLTPRIEESVDRLITQYCQLPQGADFVEHFSAPLPTEIITFLLGIPYEDHAFFTRLHESSSDRNPRRPKSASRSTTSSLSRRADHRKEREPQDDIVSRLVVEQLKPVTSTG